MPDAILRHIGIVRLQLRNLIQLYYWLRGKAKYNVMSTVKATGENTVKQQLRKTEAMGLKESAEEGEKEK